jgi:ABC-type sugar transport system ATPase subunit
LTRPRGRETIHSSGRSKLAVSPTNMQHVLRVADRVAVMRLGQKVSEVDVDHGTTGTQLVALMTGAEAGATA